MFPSSHDIRPSNFDACSKVIRSLLEAGNDLLIVSKPSLECIERLMLDLELEDYRERITFRFTIGASNPELLTFWEPGAPPFWERMESLRLAWEEGFKTSVSVEPMLEDPEHLIGFCTPFVTDTIWLGRMNHAEARLKLNGAPESVLREGRRLMAEQSDSWCQELYGRWKGHPLVRFKDSIKRVVGIASQGRGTDT
jgi:hypothetical protein